MQTNWLRYAFVPLEVEVSYDKWSQVSESLADLLGVATTYKLYEMPVPPGSDPPHAPSSTTNCCHRACTLQNQSNDIDAPHTRTLTCPDTHHASSAAFSLLLIRTP